MNAGKKNNTSYADKLKRPSFPADEKIHPWLSLLLEAYHIVDRGIAKAINAEIKKGKKPACVKGCSHCCKNQDIPVYPLELIGLCWYVTEKSPAQIREQIKKRLDQFKKSDPCPFLSEDSCSVHALRPMACRQFNVFGRPCVEGEDPYYSRRGDVLDPVKKYVDQAFFIMLPFYGIEKESERIKIIEAGAFHKMARELQSCNWKSLSEKMDEFDKKDQQANITDK